MRHLCQRPSAYEGRRTAARYQARSAPALPVACGALDTAAAVLRSDRQVGTKERPLASNKGTDVSGGACGGGTVARRVVGHPIGPGAPEHAHPGAREDANGVRVVAAAAGASL